MTGTAFSHISYGAIAGSSVGGGCGSLWESVMGKSIGGALMTGTYGGIFESEGDAIQRFYFK